MKRRTVHFWSPESVQTRHVALPPESQLCLQVNGEQLLRIAATPFQQKALAVGFLYYSGIITTLDEIAVMHLSAEGTCVDVWLTHGVEKAKRGPLLTSGCGMGQVLDELYAPLQPLRDDLRQNPETLLKMMATLQAKAELYHHTQGVHAAGIFSPAGDLLLIAEDIGRHNSLDKLLGLSLLERIDTEGRVLLTTGRVSSEMVSKAARMGTPIVASLSAFSSMAAALAQGWGITGAGYVRGKGMRIYTHPERLLDLTN